MNISKKITIIIKLKRVTSNTQTTINISRQSYNDTIYPPRFITEELHRKAKPKPINQRANYTWNKIQGMRHSVLQDLIGREIQIREEHHYFPMSRTRLDRLLPRS